MACEDGEGPAELDEAEELRGEELRLQLDQLVLGRRIGVEKEQGLGLVDEALLEAGNVFGSSSKVFFLGFSVETSWKLKLFAYLLNLECLKST